jgi:hypothetical protein
MGREVSTALGGPACYIRRVGANGAEGSIGAADLVARDLGLEVDLVRLDVDHVMLRWRVARDGVVVWANPAFEAPRFLARAASEQDEMAPLFEEAGRLYRRRLAAQRVDGERQKR